MSAEAAEKAQHDRQAAHAHRWTTSHLTSEQAQRQVDAEGWLEHIVPPTTRQTAPPIPRGTDGAGTRRRVAGVSTGG